MNHLSKHLVLVEKGTVVLAGVGGWVHEGDKEGLLVAAFEDLVQDEVRSRFRMLLLVEGDGRICLAGLCFRQLLPQEAQHLSRRFGSDGLAGENFD